MPENIGCPVGLIRTDHGRGGITPQGDQITHSVRYVSTEDQTRLSTQMLVIGCVTTVDRSMTTEKYILVHVWGNASTTCGVSGIHTEDQLRECQRVRDSMEDEYQPLYRLRLLLQREIWHRISNDHMFDRDDPNTETVVEALVDVQRMIYKHNKTHE